MRLNNMKLFNLAFVLVGLFFVILFPKSLEGFSALLAWEMVSTSSSSVDFIVLIDPISVTFASLVCFIASSVMIYSQDYMSNDSSKNRLSGLLALFILSMCLFILTPNVITMLLGWDGLGIVSYALVLFYNNHLSSGAALITALTNRIGDILIIVSLGMRVKSGHWDLIAMENLSSEKFYLFLLVAACTKSAQFPFCAWLPQAMAAPTPVSALVHSSTLVTAGVYLMIRLSGQFLPGQSWQLLMMFLATVTSSMAGLSALVETDLKKVVALSTLSQLGTMVLALSLGAPLLAFFHLVTHAVAKSLLFICVGSFISFNEGGQDTRNLKTQLGWVAPTSFVGAIIASCSLCGVPFTSGFYSKDLILESVWQSSESAFVVVGGCLSTALTGAYSVKLLKLVSEEYPSSEGHVRLVNSESKFTKVPIVSLSVFTLILGFFLNKTWASFFCPLLLSAPHKYLASFLLIVGLLMVTMEEYHFFGFVGRVHHLFHSMLFLESITGHGTMLSSKSSLYFSFKSTEQGWIEKLTVSGAQQILVSLSKGNVRLALIPSLMYACFSFFVIITAVSYAKGGPF